VRRGAFEAVEVFVSINQPPEQWQAKSRAGDRRPC
jgi:hypothetical protein